MSEHMHNPSDHSPAEVTYSAADIAALNMVIWKFWLGFIAIIVAILIAIPITFSLVDGYSLVDSIGTIDWPFTGVVILILVAWVIVVTVFSYWRRARKGLHGPIQFALTQEGLSFRSRQMQGVAFWQSIKSVRNTRGRLYLFIDRRVAFIIPRRAFASDQEFEAFAAAAKAHWRQARSPTSDR
jgi:hypothetical protein